MKNNTVEAVLFDLDGTLLDTADDLGAALNYVLTKYQQPIVEAEAYRVQASNGAIGLLTLGFGEKLKHYNLEQLRTELLNYYHENIAKHTRLYSGIPELLATLNNNNIPWGVVTNKPEQLTLRLLPYFNEFKQCAVIVGGDTLSQRKPHPAPLLHALNTINQVNNRHIKAENCFYVGDAPRDIEAGINAHMPTVIAGWGFIENLNDCLNWQADFIHHTPLELNTFFKK